MIALKTGWQHDTVVFMFLLFVDNDDAFDLSFSVSTDDVIVRRKKLFDLLFQTAAGHDFICILDSF